MAEEPALALNWVFGGSATISNNVVNLSDGFTQRICYLAAHSAVLYDSRQRRQVFLQGHVNTITCLAVSVDRSIIITADAGYGSLMVLWDARTGEPVRSVPQPHTHGVAALDVSLDGQWLASVGAPHPETKEQEISLWSMAEVTSPIPGEPWVTLTPRAAQNPVLQISLWSMAEVTSPIPGEPWVTLTPTAAQNPVLQISLWSMAEITSPAPGAVLPHVSSVIPAGDTQHCVRFNMNANNELLSNGPRRIYFWSWPAVPAPGSRFKFYSPPLRSKDFKQAVGNFVQSVFVPGSSQALTGTGDGDLVVWDEQGLTAQMGTSATDRRAIKLMRVHKSPITFLSTVGDYIVTGGEDGFLRFFDPLLRIVAWFEDIGCGPITCASFAASLPERLASADMADTLNKFVVPDFVVSTAQSQIVAVVSAAFEEFEADKRRGRALLDCMPTDLAGLATHPSRFVVPDFVVSTAQSQIVAVASAAFEEFEADKRRGRALLDCMPTDVAGLATHPCRPEFVVISRSGVIQRWDMAGHTCLATRTIDKARGGTIAYSRDGSFLVVGLEAGLLHIVDSQELTEQHVAKNSPAAITRVACSMTGRHVAACDAHNTVLLYAHVAFKQAMRWEFVGKARGHQGDISGLCFGETPAGKTRLFSVSVDGRCVDYDLERSSTSAGIVIGAHSDLPDGHHPTAVTFAPPLPYYKHFSSETQLIMADTNFKLSVFNPDAQALEAVYLGPTFGGPISQLLTFRSTSSTCNFLAYATRERVVGLIAWPLAGDPAQTMGLIAHPGDVQSLAISYDGRKLLTAGNDGTLHMWDVSTEALEAAAAVSAARPDRWARVLDDDDLLEDMRDYFCYAQIKAQGEEYIQERHIPGTAPVSMLPDLMRAAGYYPSNAGERADTISFEDMLTLFINHRPLAAVTQASISDAFDRLGANAEGKLSRDQLCQMLTHSGEEMTTEELKAALIILTGADSVRHALPGQVNSKSFASDVLGFDT
ncbi:MAG: hypothetical protein WDW38_008421 [Sanguina aurantia]